MKVNDNCNNNRAMKNLTSRLQFSQGFHNTTDCLSHLEKKGLKASIEGLCSYHYIFVHIIYNNVKDKCNDCIKSNMLLLLRWRKYLILEKWDKTGCKIEKIKPCTQTNETTFMYRMCTKLLSYALIQPPNFSLF